MGPNYNLKSVTFEKFFEKFISPYEFWFSWGQPSNLSRILNLQGSCCALLLHIEIKLYTWFIIYIYISFKKNKGPKFASSFHFIIISSSFHFISQLGVQEVDSEDWEWLVAKIESGLGAARARLEWGGGGQFSKRNSFKMNGSKNPKSETKMKKRAS